MMVSHQLLATAQRQLLLERNKATLLITIASVFSLLNHLPQEIRLTFQPIHQMMVSHHVLVTAQRTLQLEKLHNTLFQTLESIMISKLLKHQRNKLKSLLDINGTQRKMLMEIGLICQQLFKLEKKLLLLLVLLKLMDHLAHRMTVILHA
jgi:hypothetical protein